MSDDTLIPHQTVQSTCLIIVESKKFTVLGSYLPSEESRCNSQKFRFCSVSTRSSLKTNDSFLENLTRPIEKSTENLLNVLVSQRV